VRVGDPDRALAVVVFAGQQGRLAQELLEEGGGDAFGPLDDVLRAGQVQREVALVEADQLAAGVGVGQGQLGGQVDAAGAVSQPALPGSAGAAPGARRRRVREDRDSAYLGA
jgi:hypothetical protein